MNRKIVAALLAFIFIFALVPSFTLSADVDLRMIAQYKFDGNAANSADFTSIGPATVTGADYYEDPVFGKVLYLMGGTNGTSAAIIPGDALKDMQSVTVSGWFQHRTGTNTTNERFFDFGSSDSSSFYATPYHSSTTPAKRFGARITTNGATGEVIAGSNSRCAQGTWYYLTVVLDGVGKKLSVYRDATLIDSVDCDINLSQVISQTADSNLFIGRSQTATHRDTSMYVSDFRIYNEALSLNDITAIYNEHFSDDLKAQNDLLSVVAGLGSLTNRTENFTLPADTASGSTVTWTSSNNTYLNAATGEITRPLSSNPNALEPVTLTVTVKNGAATKSQALTVTIPRLPSDIEVANLDANAIAVASGIISNDITLPLNGNLGSTITWSSNAPEYLSNTGKVTQPAKGQGNKNVTLTATVKYGSATATRTISLIVKEDADIPVLIGIQDIEVVTPKGVYPKLPYYVPGIYKDGKEGPLVRVIWGEARVKQTRTSADPFKEVGYTTEIPGAIRNNDAVITSTAANNKVSTVKFTCKAKVTVVESVENYKSAKTSDYDIVLSRGSADFGRNVSANATINNISTSKDLNAKIILAAYDKDGVLVNYKIEDRIIKAGSKRYYDLVSDIPTNKPGYTFKVYAWDEKLAPLTDPFALSNELTLSPSYIPELNLEKFHYSQVKLEAADAAGGPANQFKINDDNMVEALTTKAMPVDSFLYMFRQTFGLPQPTGAIALTSWDSDTTKLRGHATGHYLSALSQAYATRIWSPSERAEILTRINELVDNLYIMSKMSEGDPREIPPTEGTGPITDGRGWKCYYSVNTPSHASLIRHDMDKWGKGYISAYPPDQFVMLEKNGGYNGTATSTTGIWAPYYTLHKILTGLTDCYEMTGNEKALEIAAGMGKWVYSRLSNPTLGSGTSVTGTQLRGTPQAELDNMWGRYIAGEYGGMNEVLSRIGIFTKDPDFSTCAKLFDNRWYFYGRDVLNTGVTEGTNGLQHNVDTIGDYDTLNESKHSNQHIPQILGVLRMYDDLKDSKYFEIANNFWDIAVNRYAYSVGGVCGDVRNQERFNQFPDCFTSNNGGLVLTSRPKGCESCATYNMLKLTSLMFLHQPEAKYMDYYERALYNDMIGSIAPDNSANTYHKGVSAGNNKEGYSSLYTAASAPRQEYIGHTPGYNCCGGSAMEAHTKYVDSIYSHQGDDVLYVNLYLPSTLTWGNRIIEQRNNFPSNDELKINVKGSGEFEMKLRIPYYAKNGFTVSVNGEVQNVTGTPSSYISLDRVWADGDVVTLKIPMDFHLWETPDAPNIASIMYGPMVLVGNESGTLPSYTKVTVDPADIGSVFASKDFSTMNFTLSPSYNYGSGIPRVLRPWYQFTNQANSVYYDVVAE